MSVGKIMATVFWDSSGIFLIEYLPQGTAVLAASYVDILLHLQQDIKWKRPGKLSQMIHIVYDNVWPHTATLTEALLTNLKWEVFSLLPYSPNIAPSDFHLFPGLTKSLEGRHFLINAELGKEILWHSSKSKMLNGIVRMYKYRKISVLLQ